MELQFIRLVYAFLTVPLNRSSISRTKIDTHLKEIKIDGWIDKEREENGKEEYEFASNKWKRVKCYERGKMAYRRVVVA